MCGPEARGGTGLDGRSKGAGSPRGEVTSLEALKRLGISQVFSRVTGA